MSRIYQYGYKLIPIYFVILGILCVGLFGLSYPLFEYAWIGSYLTDNPQQLTFYSNDNYSILNLITGFLLVLLIGIHAALVIAIMISIYWSEFVRTKIRNKGFNFIEILVNIPLIVYGYVLLLVFSKLMDFEGNAFKNMLIISLILGGMVLPKLVYTFISILQSISYRKREGAYSLGASRYKTAVMVLIPSQIKLFVAAIINTASRALSEVLIILFLAGFILETVEVIISIVIISIVSTTLSQWLKKSHEQHGTV